MINQSVVVWMDSIYPAGQGCGVYRGPLPTGRHVMSQHASEILSYLKLARSKCIAKRNSFIANLLGF